MIYCPNFTNDITFNTSLVTIYQLNESPKRKRKNPNQNRYRHRIIEITQK